jgi:anti-sigma-K factor RskA
MNPRRGEHDPELDELLGAFAADAVEDDERAEIEQYLARHDPARQEVARYTDVLAALADAEVEEPPSLVWERVQGALTRTEPVLDLTAARGGRRLRRLPLLAAAALLLVVAAVGVGVVNLRGSSDTAPDLAELAEQARSTPGARFGVLEGSAGEARVVIEPDGDGFLFADSLAAAGDGLSYQLWSLDGDVPVSLGVMGDEGTIMHFHGDSTSTLALSVEPAGGSPEPSLPPVAMGTV